MLTLIIRSIIIYIIVLIVFRLMGKRQLGQMQPFELVLTLILADLATIPMSEISIPLMHGIVPLLALLVIHYVITIITRISPKFSELISGKPVIVIDQNGINYKAVKKLNLNIDDIFEQLRGAGYFSVDEVLFAIMETNGKISVLPKAKNSPVSRDDLKIKYEENSMPVILISEGKILKENFCNTKVKKEEVLNYIQKLKLKIKNLLIFTLDNNGIVYYQEMNKRAQTIQTNLKDENK
mgnify:CR=1 FL=1